MNPALRTILLGTAPFNPTRKLFSSGEVGVFFDPSDQSVLFQDSAGTTPVTAVSQAVGLVLDKSQGLAVGSSLKGSGATGLVGAATAAAYNTSTGAGSVSRVNATNQSYVQWSGLTNTTTYKVTISNTGSATLSLMSGSQAGTSVATVAASQSATMYAVPSSGLLTIVATNDGTSASFTVSAIASIAGYHASQATSGSRPTWQQDASGLYYLSFDGFDDSLATPSIDFTGTDKMTVIAGIQKASDAATGIVSELTASAGANNGAFDIVAPSASVYQIGFNSKGTTIALASTNAAAYAAPVTAVVTGIGDISGDKSELRVNGASLQLTTTDQGTGTFSNAQLFIGRRNNASLPFNGRMYSFIARGAQTAYADLIRAERYVGRKTGIYL